MTVVVGITVVVPVVAPVDVVVAVVVAVAGVVVAVLKVEAVVDMVVVGVGTVVAGVGVVAADFMVGFDEVPVADEARDVGILVAPAEVVPLSAKTNNAISVILYIAAMHVTLPQSVLLLCLRH